MTAAIEIDKGVKDPVIEVGRAYSIAERCSPASPILKVTISAITKTNGDTYVQFYSGPNFGTMFCKDHAICTAKEFKEYISNTVRMSVYST